MGVSHYAAAPGLLPGAVVSTTGYDLRGMPPQLHRGLPSPHLTFIFSLGDPVVSAATPEGAVGRQATRTDILLAGLHPGPTFVVQPETQSGIQLAVHPLAARRLLGAAASQLPGEVLQAEDVLGADVQRVRHRLLDEDAWPGRFRVLADYLRVRWLDSREPSVRPELVAAWSWLSERQGAGSVDELAGHVRLSGRQLRALFHAEVGIGPKRVAGLMRFDAAKQDIAAAVVTGGPLGLAGIAAARGYCDQAHLDADFGRHAGVSPTGWVQEERRNIQAGGHQPAVD